ncbi:transcriptional regulator [Streptomyces sp. NPDC001930]|uniref:tetratricopeptide repeat protein n=1 Tax=Streptomyces sp. NPDC001930 TaxID=3364625 RepID=UPI0036BFB2A4
MASDQLDSRAALAQLRRELEAGRIAMRLDKTALARRADLGRTTVSNAFSHTAEVPSADTVGALARALRLGARSLLNLRATAAAHQIGADSVDEVRETVGLPIEHCDPHDLEVHPAIETIDRSGAGAKAGRRRRREDLAMPEYVHRAHDDELAGLVAAVRAGRSCLAVLVGSSSTGKTRACWEAVQALAAEGWRLWHPFDPTRVEAALADLGRVGPNTVVWLNEAQHYLGAARGRGERLAAGLHTLLTDAARAPVLVLATLWPQYADMYTGQPRPGLPDPHKQVRELFAGRLIAVPDTFDPAALRVAEGMAAAGDSQWAHAVAHARDGRFTQYLAGAPELLLRYDAAAPATRAVLHAAMDARRLGVGLHLPMAFLAEAAEDYLTDAEFDVLADDWFEEALADAGRPVHGKLSPLHSIRRRRSERVPSSATDAGPLYRLADYLEQHGRQRRGRHCPPRSFWDAAHRHLTDPGELSRLASAADARLRLYWAYQLWCKVADGGDASALGRLADLRETVGDGDQAEQLALRAGRLGSTEALQALIGHRESSGDHASAERLAFEAVDCGDPGGLMELARLRGRTAGIDVAADLYQQAVDAGATSLLAPLASLRARTHGYEAAADLYQQAVDSGDASSRIPLAQIHLRSGNREAAVALHEQAVDAGDTGTATQLAELLEVDAAEYASEDIAGFDPHRFHGLVFHGGGHGGRGPALGTVRAPAPITDPVQLARLRMRAGEYEAAAALYEQAAATGDTRALLALVPLREAAGDREAAELAARQAARAGSTQGLNALAWRRERNGDSESADALYRAAAEAGGRDDIAALAWFRERQGDHASAEQLARHVADMGNARILAGLVERREWAGEREAAERLALWAADAGDTHALAALVSWWGRKGLDTAAHRLAVHAADAGNSRPLIKLAERSGRDVRAGLEPDGAPSASW